MVFKWCAAWKKKAAKVLFAIWFLQSSRAELAFCCLCSLYSSNTQHNIQIHLEFYFQSTNKSETQTCRWTLSWASVSDLPGSWSCRGRLDSCLSWSRVSPETQHCRWTFSWASVDTRPRAQRVRQAGPGTEKMYEMIFIMLAWLMFLHCTYLLSCVRDRLTPTQSAADIDCIGPDQGRTQKTQYLSGFEASSVSFSRLEEEISP